jgi:hypothetical protein
MRVTHEGSSGGRAEADVHNVGADGLFVPADPPPPVGKRLSLEISTAGGGPKWSALGRVVWVRTEVDAHGPRGVGVKFIDIDDAGAAAIERLVSSRERTEPGAGSNKPPSRERTVHGVGATEGGGAAAAPIVVIAPVERERTVLGVGAPAAPSPKVPPAPASAPASAPQLPPDDAWEGADVPTSAPALAPERSIAIDLVARKPDAAPDAEGPHADPPPRTEASPPSEASLVAAGVPRRRGGRWLALLVLFAAIGAGGYVMRAPLRVFVARWLPSIAPAPPAPPPAPVPVAPPGTASSPESAPASSSSASPAPSAGASSSASPLASASSQPVPSASSSAKPDGGKPGHKPPGR